MKRCPTCSRSFDDDSLSFCLDDGTPLVGDLSQRRDSQETLVSPPPSFPHPETSGLPGTQAADPYPGKATVTGSQFDSSAAQAYGAPKPRRTWPWVVAILFAVLLIGGIVIAAVMIPPMLRAANDGNRAQPTPVPPDRAAKATPESSPADSADDVPDDEDEVLAQLTKLEEEWTRANVKGDKQALEDILADEYTGGPTTHSKREYINSLTPDTSIKSWELRDLAVDQDDERATVKGTLIDQLEKGEEAYSFEDKFVWRDHRWQAVASQSSRVK